MRSMFGPIEQISSYRSRHDVLKSGAMLSIRYPDHITHHITSHHITTSHCNYPSHHITSTITSPSHHITSHHPSHHLHITSHIKSPWPPRAAKKHCSASIVSHELPKNIVASACSSKRKWSKVSLGRHLSANAAELGENGDLHHMHITSHQITITSHHIIYITLHSHDIPSHQVTHHITSHHPSHHITSPNITFYITFTSPLHQHHITSQITSHHKIADVAHQELPVFFLGKIMSQTAG